jgi:predicted nucleic acid-binding Zn ribbon protein
MKYLKINENIFQNHSPVQKIFQYNCYHECNINAVIQIARKTNLVKCIKCRNRVELHIFFIDIRSVHLKKKSVYIPWDQELAYQY